MQTFVASSAKFKGDDVHDGLVEIDFMFCAIFWRTCVACEMNCGGYFLRRSTRVSPPLFCVFFVVNKIERGQQPPRTLEAAGQGVEALNAGRRQTGCGEAASAKWTACMEFGPHMSVEHACVCTPLQLLHAAAHCRQRQQRRVWAAASFSSSLGVWHCGVCVGWRHSGLVCVRRVTHLHVLHTCTA